jgi:hypothetical protein
MPDEVLNIRVTERELDLIMDLLNEAGTRTDANGQPAIEICHDLMEQAARPGDWTEDLEPTEIVDPSVNHTFTATEQTFIQAGIDAREQAKASSRAAARRSKAFGEFEVSKPDRKLSDQQLVDVWNPDDPRNW